MENQKPYLILRKTRANRYTLPVLLGCLEAEGLSGEFHIIIADHIREIALRLDSRPAVVGYSFMTPHLEQVKKELARLKKHADGGMTFLAGGPHATGDPEGTIRLGFDYVFSGEAEATLPGFLRRFLEGNLPDGQVLRGEKNSLLFTQYPPHSLEHRFFAPVEITRGCHYGCSFCQAPRIFGRTLRHRNPNTIARHLARTIPFGYRQTAFISSNAFSYGSSARGEVNLSAIEELLADSLKAGLEGLRFGCYPSEVRPDWVTPEILDLVRRYCRNKTIVLGAQSGSDSLLTKLKRGHTARQSMDAVQWISQAGFMPHVDFVFGFPEETTEDRRLSLEMMARMIREYGARIHAHTYMPLPGTPLFGKEPSRLDMETKNSLKKWEKRDKLDGWWEEQETAAWNIVKWRDRGIIGSPASSSLAEEN